MENKQAYKYIGRGRPLVEGRGKVTGSTRYVADLRLPGMLHGRPILSPYAHARIGSVDKSRAEAVPGVVAVLTAEDLPTRDQVITWRSSAVLAQEKVLFVGQPVAIVVAETAADAADAAELVIIDYEPLPAVIRAQSAIQAGAPVLWPYGLPVKGEVSNIHTTSEGQAAQNEAGLNNVSAETHFQRGDIATGLAESGIIIERTYHSNPVHQSYLEPLACVASPDPFDGSITIYTSTQGKFIVRDEVARLLSMPPKLVRVVPMTIGGGFGAKYGILEPLTAAAALTLQCPVQIVLSRSEDFLTTTPAPGIIIELKTGAKQDGTVTALQARVLVDNGVFNFPFGNQGEIAGTLLGGIYKFPHVKIDAYEVNTHKAPVGAYRAPAGPQAAFALESNIDDMASALDLDPLEFRLKNVAETGDLTGAGQPWPSVNFKMCLNRLKAHPAWQNRRKNAGEGLGLAVSGWATAVGTAEAICRVDSDGTVSVELGHVDVTGNDSTFVLIAAEALGVEPNEVLIVHGDTTGGAYGPLSGGSQVTYSVAGAVDMAAQLAKAKLLQVASDEFEAAPEDIELVAGKAQVKGVPAQAITLGELSEIARSKRGGPGPIVGQGQAAIEQNAPAASAHLVKVKVDPETGQVQPVQYVIVQDVGLALNPLLVEGQLHGGMVQGLGIGLHEAMVYDEAGQLLSGSFMDYTLPRMNDVPRLEATLVENPAPHGPFGARGVGEPPILGGAAAVANAIKDATGVRLTTTPIRSEVLWDHLRRHQ
jgi:CO/xanthine dehydrogenase Mo-binding subunit